MFTGKTTVFGKVGFTGNYRGARFNRCRNCGRMRRRVREYSRLQSGELRQTRWTLRATGSKTGLLYFFNVLLIFHYNVSAIFLLLCFLSNNVTVNPQLQPRGCIFSTFLKGGYTRGRGATLEEVVFFQLSSRGLYFSRGAILEEGYRRREVYTRNS